MESTDLIPLLEDLGENVDELEESLGSLLKTNLADITSKLPLLEKAKLHVLVTYAIESILFSTLKLNGVDAREHPVFRELTRVKQYFAKINEADDGGPQKRENMSLHKAAAARVIKNALAGNHDHDRKRAEHRSEQRINSRKRFEQESEQIGTTQRFRHVPKDQIVASSDATSTSSPSSSSFPEKDPAKTKKRKSSHSSESSKRQKHKSKQRPGDTPV